MNKRIQKKIAKLAEAQKLQQQVPMDVQQAFDALYDALRKDPEWHRSTTCLFIGTDLVGTAGGQKWRGKLHTAGSLSVQTSQTYETLYGDPIE